MPAPDGPIVVTGAAGFIGRATVAALLAAGHTVRAGLHRTPLPPDLSSNPRVTTFTYRADDAAALAPALAGAAAIVHVAYGSGAPAALAPQLEALLAAADQSGIARIVYTSSIAAYGSRAGHIREGDGPVRPLSAYGAAKAAADARLSAWAAAAPGRTVVSTRPGIVYGPGSHFWIDTPLRRIRAGALGPMGRLGEGLAALVHVDDVARALALAVHAPEGVHLLNIVAADGMTWNTYFTRLAEAAGLPVHRLAPATVAARALLVLPAKALRRAPLAPGVGELALYARRATYDIAAADRAIGWRPQIAAAAAIAPAVAASLR